MRNNILLEISLKNDGMLGHLAMNMIEEAFKKNDSTLVCWRRDGDKILVRSTEYEIFYAINTKKFNRYQKSVLIYKEIRQDDI